MDTTTAGYNDGEENHKSNEGQDHDLPASSSVQNKIKEQQQKW